MQTHLPTDLLRAFVTVIDHAGNAATATATATALGRTRTAIRQQLRRLNAPNRQPLPPSTRAGSR